MAQPSPDRSRTRPLALELAGPAGAGKSTLRKMLIQSDPQLIAAPFPTRRQSLRQLPGVALRVLPGYLRPSQADRRFRWDEVRSMLYLQAWLDWLPATPGDCLFDQGPVFRLAVLREFGPRPLGETAAARWWQRMLVAWSGALDLVVWLDATNDELLARIHRRAKPHRCKALNRDAAHALLDRYRAAHESVLSAMRRAGNPPLVRLASDRQTPADIARAVGDELAGLRGSPRRAGTVSATAAVN